MTIDIIFPIYNEDQRLISGVEKTMAFLKENADFDYIVTLADNGSDEEHQEIGRGLAEKYENLEYFYTPKKGVGNAFREAAQNSDADAVGYMDVDLSTPVENVVLMADFIRDGYKAVNGSRLAPGSQVYNRSLLRTVASRVLNFFVRSTFKTSFTDCMCGFKFFDAETLKKLIQNSSDDNGWFYCAELLIRAEKDGINIKEIPVTWTDDKDSKVKVAKISKQYLKRIKELKKALKNEGKL